MEIRGQRECQDCGRQWSYYETGAVACPACGSLRSVGVDERTRHTDSPVTLDLTEHRVAADEGSIEAVADDLKSTLRTYIRGRGFVNEGELRDLDDTYLAAHELLQAVDVYSRLRDPGDDERWYVYDLLRGADFGERPAPGTVPARLTEARGLAYADAVTAYRRGVSTWMDDHPDPEAAKTLGTLAEQLKRVNALQGDVDPATAETLVQVAREVADYLREDDESALATARDRLSRL